MQNSLTQRARVIALAIDLILLMFFCFIGFGMVFPPAGNTGNWFYTALLSSIVGSKLATPYYIKPVDAISYALPAFVSLMLMNNWESWDFLIKLSFLILVGLNLAILSIAFATIILNNSSAEKLQNLSNLLRSINELIAKPQVVYVPLIVFTILAFHSTSSKEIIVIFLSVLLTVAISTGEVVVKFFTKFNGLRKNNLILNVVGEVIAYQQPNMYLVRQLENQDLPLKAVYFVKYKDSDSKLLLSLDYVGHEQGSLIRTVEIASFSRGKYHDIESSLAYGYLALLSRDTLNMVLGKERISNDAYSNVVGIVTSDSTIQRLYFEVVNNNDLEDGRLVSVNVGKTKVLYQIVDGLTREDIVHQKNTYGYLRVQAQQIGVWMEDLVKFEQYSWLPMINSPVFLEAQTAFEIERDTIGHFPDSNYQIKVGNINQLVTHNTAILGILGVGKTMLAIELLERMMAEGIKVVCLDLTNQYATELRDFYDVDYEKECLSKISAASDMDRNSIQENPEDGGSRKNLHQAIYDDLKEFINGTHSRQLKIYNPAQFVATRQERAPTSVNNNGQWSRLAALYSVTPVEVTQIVSEAVLDILSVEMSATAKVCLVYEEAHSLVPEWNSVVAESDKNATSGTARAILQGRKFGLGCLVVTQRTANVTKTILNQCNTIFAMRTFDDTGKDFLSNYIGKDYAQSLSSIKERHAVFFGRGSSCENPVLMKLNNSQEFRDCFRKYHPPPPLPELEPEPTETPIESNQYLSDFSDLEDDNFF